MDGGFTRGSGSVAEGGAARREISRKRIGARNDLAQLLDTLQEGDPVAADQLLVLVYAELRRLAAAKMSREARWCVRLK